MRVSQAHAGHRAFPYRIFVLLVAYSARLDITNVALLSTHVCNTIYLLERIVSRCLSRISSSALAPSVRVRPLHSKVP
jgi:hypothetical protein